ncbi:hypothetical protein QNI19_24235 [Cytophagaceae bacterium DM2B3-1]|uniref:Knr4/Smi1-like domain-containing protein n=1 Tax=Xanthocytophaga flava TaxID=3048013 RepID=A0ABT7CQP4_9BACT|nr:hypothetical protein [Xanthocytophaga flavus]MDJ1496067.1 hypothetical protein [Xanthocytophaga flavus]
MQTIPENITEFLYWFKERTEAFWNANTDVESDDFVCDDWIRGAKWIGMEETQIDEIEKKYAIRFTPDHREFLKILHTIDRKEVTRYTDFENGEEITEERPFFYNWFTDEQEIRSRLEWPYRTVLEDVKGMNGVWIKSWGKRPQSETEKEAIFTEWYKQAPTLLPLKSHRFMVSEPCQAGNPILSVWGSDIIVYGWDLRSYLLHELGDHLNMYEWVFDQEDQEWYTELPKEINDISAHNRQTAIEKHIPFWEEVILYWSSGWSSFGKRYPYPTDSSVQPIVPTYIPEEEVESEQTTIHQKRFTPFT